MRSSFLRTPSRTNPLARKSSTRRGRLWLEALEDRLVLSNNYVALGGLAFCSDSAPVITGTDYLFASSNIQFGYAVSDPADFVPVYLVNGEVSFDSSNQDAFTLFGTLTTAALANGSNVSIWSSSSGETLDVSDLLDSGAALPGAERVAVAGVPLQVLRIGLEEVENAPVAALRGDLDFTFGSTSLQVAVEGENFAYVADNRVQMTGAAISVTTSFDFAGLEIDIDASNPVSLVYDGLTDEFEMSGAVTLSVGNPDNSTSRLTATMGTPSNPGLIVSNGTLEQLDFTIDGGFTINHLDFTADGCGLNYSDANDSYAFFGTATLQLTQGISGSASLGTEADPGVTVVDGDWDLNNFAVSIEKIPLGVFSIDDLEINYNSANEAYGGQAVLVFPGGWGIGGGLEFVGGTLSDIGLTLDFGSGGIPMGPTGLFVATLSAGVGNLDNPSNLIVAGNIIVTYGPSFDIGSIKDVSIVAAEGEFYCDANELFLQADVYLGCYTLNQGNDLLSLIGQGSGTIDLDWGDGEYSLDLSAEMIDGTFTVDARFALDTNGSLFIGGEAAVNVPDAVPLIGGDSLLSMDFDLNWQQTGGENNGPQGVVAAWVDVFGQDVGLAYNLVSFMGSQDEDSWELIGNEQVEILENGGDIFNSGTATYNYTVPFSLPLSGTPQPISAIFSALWSDVGGQQTFAVILPNGQTLNPSSSLVDGISIYASPTQPTQNTQPGQKSYSMQVYIEGTSSLPAGTYTAQVTSTVPLSLPVSTTSNQWTATYSYVQPQVVINSLPPQGATPLLAVSLSGSVQSGLESQSKFALYVDNDGQGYNGALLHLNGSDVSVPYGGGSATINVDLSGLLPQTYYLYATVDDGFNPITTSSYAAVTVTPSLYGTVTNAMTSGVLATIAVWVDNPTNPNGVYDPSEDYSVTTNSAGYYSFGGPTATTTFQPGVTYTVGVVVGPGYELPTSETNPKTFTYGTGSGQTTNAEINFSLNQFTYLSGVIFNDQNNDGVQNDNEPFIPNVSVTLTGGGDTQTAFSNNSGVYTFYSLAVNTSYTATLSTQQSVSGLTVWKPISYSITTDSNAYGQYQAKNFPVAVPVAISGTVSGYPTGSTTEIGLSGWKVTATGHDANTFSHTVTATTDSNGNYTFSTLLPGSYTITETVMPGWYEVGPVTATQSWQAATGLATGGSGSYPLSVDSGDIDGDGYVDLLVAIDSADVKIWWGGQTPYTSTSKYSNFSSLVQALLGDANGDGKLDLYVVRVSSTPKLHVDVYLNNGGGRSEPFNTTGFGYEKDLDSDQSVLPQAVIADYNQDGKDDVTVMIQPAGNAKRLRIQSTGSSFTNDDEDGSTAGGVAVGDLDGDGYPDNVYWTNDSNSTNLTFDFGGKDSKGNIDFDTHAMSYGYSKSVLVDNLALGDIDRDGDLDIIFDLSFGNSDDYNLYYFLNPGSRSSLLDINSGPPIVDFGDSDARQTVPEIIVSDFNVDGYPDIATYTKAPRTKVFTSKGSATADGSGGSSYYSGTGYFQFPSSTYLSGNPVFVFGQQYQNSGDLNKDGLPDLILISSGYNGLAIYYNQFVATTPGYTVQTTNPTQGLVTSPSGLEPNFINHQFAQVTGLVYVDVNRNGSRDPGERGLKGFTVFVDNNDDGQYEPGEASGVTNDGGLYTLFGDNSDLSRVRVLGRPGWHIAPPILVNRGGIIIAEHAATHALLSPAVDQVMQEGDLFRFTIGKTSQAELHDVPLVFRLLDAPAGMTIDPHSGKLSWNVPTAYTGASHRGVTVEVFDPRNPLFSETSVFDLLVLQKPDDGPTALGGASGTAGFVEMYDLQTGQTASLFQAYEGFNGKVRVAAGDVNGDGVADIITGAGPGAGPHVKVFDGVTGATIQSFYAFDAAYTGGIWVASGDINGDGFDDLVVGAAVNSHVKAFSGRDGSLMASFFAYDGFGGAVTVAAGDVNGDGYADIITGSGPGSSAHVKVFSGKDLSTLASFLAFEGFTGGVYVAAGDLDRDGYAEIIVGAGAGGAPHVKVFAGVDHSELASFYAYDASFSGGVRVGTGLIDGVLALLTAAGPGAGPHVKALDILANEVLISLYVGQEGYTGGVYLA